MPRQFWQSLGQFAIIFFTNLLLNNPQAPQSVAELLPSLWNPSLQGIIGALGIWGFSKAPLGKHNG